MRFPGTAADYMRWFREVAIPVDFIWERLGPDETERAIEEIVANMRQFEDRGAVQTRAHVGKGRLMMLFAPVNRRVGGSSPP